MSGPLKRKRLVVKNQTRTGKNSFAGFGAVVVKSVRDNMLAAGIPAEEIREVKKMISKKDAGTMERKMPKMFGLLIYVMLSAAGLTIIKIGVSKEIVFRFGKAGISLELNYLLLLGMCIYAVSFLSSMFVMRTMNLSIFYPVSAGLIYIVICMMSVFVLKESVSVRQLIGMAVIFAGIIIMNMKKV